MSYSSVYSISSMNIQEQKNSLAGLILKAKTGDSGSFGGIYNLFFEKIYRFVFYRVNHKETAEDLTEEVFLKAFSKITNLNESSSFEGWLYQIARNLIIDYYREKKITIDLEEIENTLQYESTVLNTLDLEQDQKNLLKLIKQLPAEQQIILKLKFFEELENSEIASILNKTEGSIRVIQHRAITKLKELSSNQA